MNPNQEQPPGAQTLVDGPVFVRKTKEGRGAAEQQHAFFATAPRSQYPNVISPEDVAVLVSERSRRLYRKHGRVTQRNNAIKSRNVQALQLHYGLSTSSEPTVPITVYEYEGRLVTEAVYSETPTFSRRELKEWNFFFAREGNKALDDSAELEGVVKRNAASFDKVLQAVAPAYRKDMFDAGEPIKMEVPEALRQAVVDQVTPRFCEIDSEGKLVISMRLHPEAAPTNGTVNYSRLLKVVREPAPAAGVVTNFHLDGLDQRAQKAPVNGSARFFEKGGVAITAPFYAPSLEKLTGGQFCAFKGAEDPLQSEEIRTPEGDITVGTLHLLLHGVLSFHVREGVELTEEEIATLVRGSLIFQNCEL